MASSMLCQGIFLPPSLKVSASAYRARMFPSVGPPIQISYGAPVCSWTRDSMRSCSSHRSTDVREHSCWTVARAKPPTFPHLRCTHGSAFCPAGKPLFDSGTAWIITSCSASNEDHDSIPNGDGADGEECPSAPADSPGRPPADVSNLKGDIRTTAPESCTESDCGTSAPTWESRWNVPWEGWETAGGMALYMVMWVGCLLVRRKQKNEIENPIACILMYGDLKILIYGTKNVTYISQPLFANSSNHYNSMCVLCIFFMFRGLYTESTLAQNPWVFS